MFIGCLPLTSLRFSSLECFYDQLCLNKVQQAINLTSISIMPLNGNRSSANRNVSEIIDNLMLREWTSNISYREYFNECQPAQCIYSIIQRNSWLVVFTTVLGLCKLERCSLTRFNVLMNRWWFDCCSEFRCTDHCQNWTKNVHNLSIYSENCTRIN